VSNLAGKSWPWAGLALLAALIVQFSLVQSKFEGDWTGLFYSGDHWRLPADLNGSTFRHPNSLGYDGQFYRLASHDPFNLKGYSQFMDAPAYRRKRALVPLLAWAVSFGQTKWIDAAYIAVLNGFVFLGAWFAAELARNWSRHPAWGMAFLLAPVTLNGIDRMLPDVALGAAMVGFLLFHRRWPALSWALLAASVMSRELGLLVVAAAVGQQLWERRWPTAALWASAALPALCWWRYCDWAHAAPGSGIPSVGWQFTAPVYGFVLRILHPVAHQSYALLAQTMDAAAMCGLLAGGVMACQAWWRNRNGIIEWQALAGASLVVAASNPYFLMDAYSYPRAFTLLALPLALIALRSGKWLFAIPGALVALRLIAGIVRELQ
jgi:hypothetical protein